MAMLTDDEARAKMEAHHKHLREALAEGLAELDRACAANDGVAAETAAGRLEVLLVEEILPHAGGEERSLYAAALPKNRALIGALTDDHVLLRAWIDACRQHDPDLGTPAGRMHYLGLVHEIAALFSAHAHKEDHYVTPLVLESSQAGTLARLFEEMHAPATR